MDTPKTITLPLDLALKALTEVTNNLDTYRHQQERCYSSVVTGIHKRFRPGQRAHWDFLQKWQVEPLVALEKEFRAAVGVHLIWDFEELKWIVVEADMELSS